MPKPRHNDDDSAYIRHKIKKLERKLLKSRRRNRKGSENNRSSLSSDSSPQRSNIEGIVHFIAMCNKNVYVH